MILIVAFVKVHQLVQNLLQRKPKEWFDHPNTSILRCRR